MKKSQTIKIIMARVIATPIVFASIFVVGAAPKAHARECSVASLEGAYGFHVGALVFPAPAPAPGAILAAGTPRAIYTVDNDCTGKIFTNAGTKTIEIVVVNGGNEFYQLRTDAPNILFLFNSTAKKQLPGDSQN
jgi:hypothetical protein